MARTKKNLSAKTINLIRKMIDLVVDNYKTYDQNNWPTESAANSLDLEKHICNTDFCAAGFAIVAKSGLKGFKKVAEGTGGYGTEGWSSKARESLGISSEDGFNGSTWGRFDTLFGSSGNWPAPFNNQYSEAKTPRGRAKAFARRWEFFINTDGTDDRTKIVKA